MYATRYKVGFCGTSQVEKYLTGSPWLISTHTQINPNLCAGLCGPFLTWLTSNLARLLVSCFSYASVVSIFSIFALNATVEQSRADCSNRVLITREFIDLLIYFTLVQQFFIVKVTCLRHVDDVNHRHLCVLLILSTMTDIFLTLVRPVIWFLFACTANAGFMDMRLIITTGILRQKTHLCSNTKA